MNASLLKKAIGPDLVNTNKIFSTIDAKGASGYLLVCKNDATASLKRKFNECSVESKKKFIIWNGSQLCKGHKTKRTFPNFSKHFLKALI